MKGWLLVFLVWVATIAIVFTVLCEIGEAQPVQAPASCASLPACMADMVTDLREYRTWLEEQLSLCKTLNRAANATLNDKQAEIEALKKKLAPAEEPKP